MADKPPIPIIAASVLSAFLTAFLACGTSTQAPLSNAEPEQEQAPQILEQPAAEIDPSLLERLKNEHWSGDLDGLRERRYIRALVLYNKTNFFYDGPQPRGATYDALKEFEKFLNAKLNTGDKPIYLVFIPVSRADALKRMKDGRGDLAASNFAIVEEAQQFVDFSDPVVENVRQLVVTGPASEPIASVDDLAGKEIYVRKLSRFWSNLEHLNDQFKAAGKPPMILKEADANLEDEDILDMVNAGIVGATVADELIANIWSKVYDGIKVHDDISIGDADKIAWAMQKNTPQLAGIVNEFVKGHKVGTVYGNVLLQQYFKNTKWAQNSVAPQEMAKLKDTAELFKKYGAEYKFDWLMIAAQAYQESTIDQSKKSPAGAVGVMQIKPSTAAGDPINITGVDSDTEKNIRAGVKYMNFIMENYFKDATMTNINRGLFAFASYNAGPNRIAKLRKEAEAQGLDPNKWFNNVELVVAKDIGAETVTYVSNIYKYYIAYKMVSDSNTARKKKS